VRLRAVADAYGLPSDRTAFVDVITETMMDGGTFVRRRVERGEPTSIGTGGIHQTRRHQRFDEGLRPEHETASV
jgi:hypothetical protein